MDEYTAEQQAELARLTTGFGEQDGQGVDLTLLRANLRLTPLERLRRLQENARFMERLQNAARPRTDSGASD